MLRFQTCPKRKRTSWSEKPVGVRYKHQASAYGRRVAKRFRTLALPKPRRNHRVILAPGRPELPPTPPPPPQKITQGPLEGG